MKQRPSRLYLIICNPLRLLLAIYHSLALLLPTLLYRLLLPTACSPTSFKVEVLRCWLAGFLVHFWDLIFKAPVEWPRLLGGRQRYETVMLGPSKVPTVIVPPSSSSLMPRSEPHERPLPGGLPRASAEDDKGKKTAVLLWAHGGGYLFGEPLQYLATYERWVMKAKVRGLIVFAVDYSESPFQAGDDHSLGVISYYQPNLLPL